MRRGLLWIFALICVGVLGSGCPSSQTMLTAGDPQLVGTWTGTAVTALGSSRYSLTFTDEGGFVMRALDADLTGIGKYGTNPTVSPRLMDVLITESNLGASGQVCRGVYTISNGILRYGYNAAGKPRPTSFDVAFARMTLTKGKAAIEKDASIQQGHAIEVLRSAAGDEKESLLSFLMRFVN